jgi:hypothetical protein
LQISAAIEEAKEHQLLLLLLNKIHNTDDRRRIEMELPNGSSC